MAFDKEKVNKALKHKPKKVFWSFISTFQEGPDVQIN